ncbi:hypothetical protein GCM10022386_05910 [Flavobacterium cheonhonense]|uniref:Uncharacterized protein n=1 Tax=Flavobacterium cheonhonense TaxID=706185 RepID=A0ABP7TFV3_9FLAO|nr:hypothetical protein [Flavobacterium cheonhonense]PJE42476.1 MAG: hypothetical protein CUR32_04950 [Flavobacterium sp.] [Flavobacterium sp. FEMGT703F]
MNIKISPEYGCFPLWISEKDEIYSNVNHYDLNFSEDLKKNIENWNIKFQQTLNKEYPPDSSFGSLTDLIEFENEGILVWRDINKQMSNVNVSYFSLLKDRYYYNLDELISEINNA